MSSSAVNKAFRGIPTAAGLGLLMASSTYAQTTIFDSNFESGQGYTSGSVPSASQNIYPDQPNGVYGKPASATPYWNTKGWTAGGNSATQNDAYVITDPSNASNHAAAFVGDSSGGTIASSVVAASLGTLDTTADLTISQSAYFPSNVGNTTSRSLILGKWGGGNFPMMSFGEGGYFTATRSTYATDKTPIWSYNRQYDSAPLTEDAWHTAAITIHFNQADLALSTVDFVVDGVHVQDAIPFNATALATNTNSYFAYVDNYPYVNTQGYILLDDVLITQAVPEPASAGLLALAGGALLRRRRNHSPK
jgi:hypothetical protein